MALELPEARRIVECGQRREDGLCLVLVLHETKVLQVFDSLLHRAAVLEQDGDLTGDVGRFHDIAAVFLHEELDKSPAGRRVRRVGIRTGSPCLCARECGKIEIRAAQLLILERVLIDQSVVLDALRQCHDRVLPAGSVEHDADKVHEGERLCPLRLEVRDDALEELLVIEIAAGVEDAGRKARHLRVQQHSVMEALRVHLPKDRKHLLRHIGGHLHR